jgi:murein DD-endopeptidase MepM/ murein hydrolase activator NlpD
MISFKNNPTKNIRITSKFGMRKHPVTGIMSMHNGTDFGAIHSGQDGDELYAVADGKVLISKVNNGGPTKGYGYYTTIQHDGFSVLYAHMMNLKMKEGQTVKAGDIVGHMGTSGTSTSTHLHFGVQIGTKWINPEDYILKGGYDVDTLNAIQILKLKLNLSNETIKYLTDYKYGKELVIKIADAIKNK